MSEIGPWLVVGGALLVIVCVGITLVVLLRVLRRTRSAGEDAWSARSALAEAAVGGSVDDDELMPLLLCAAIEVTRADAAAVTFVRIGDRRRSYSANLHVLEARRVVDALVALQVPEAVDQRYARSVRVGHVFPITRPGVVGALAVYWRDEAPRGVGATDLEELLAVAFRSFRPVGAFGRQPASPRRADEDEHERWSRVADLNGTLEPRPLLRRIVDATHADCGADAAAAGIRGLAEHELIAETSQLAEHEQEWAESVLVSETVVPSITRYIAPNSETVAGTEASIATAIVVPLRDSDGDTIGNVVAVWRRDLAGDGDKKLAELELLVDDARAALGNATRFQRLQSIAVRDPMTGLFDQRYFFGLLAGAVEAARRTSQPLVLLLFAASEIEPGTHDVRVASLEQALLNGSARIAQAVGDLGATCRVGLGEFTAIVPNTDVAGVHRLVEEVSRDLSVQAADEPRLKWSSTTLQLDDSERADELWQRARRELRPERGALAGMKSATTPVVSRTVGL